MRIYWITDFPKGALGMMARPRGNDWLEDEIKKLAVQNVEVVVSLLESHEENELEIRAEGALCEQLGLQFIQHPIQDRSIPLNDAAFYQLIAVIDALLQTGKKVVVHCRMGIGRTAVVAAAALIKNGFDSEHVFEHLSEIRTLDVPDTADQIEWTISRANAIKAAKTTF
jgi:protein-tyrosine phosphatase